jgi:hypothetical protein
MAKGKQRVLYTSFWEDEYVEEELREPDEKLLYAYLMLNPYHEISGLYQISIKKIAKHTEMETTRVEEILKRLEADEKICYDGREILLLNYLKINWNGSEKNQKRVRDDLKLIHNKAYVKEWFALAAQYDCNPIFTFSDVCKAPGKEEGTKREPEPAKETPIKDKLPLPLAPTKGEKTTSPSKREAKTQTDVEGEVEALVGHFKATMREVVNIDAQVCRSDETITSELLKKYPVDTLKNLIEFCVDLSQEKNLAQTLGAFMKPYFINQYTKAWDQRKGTFVDPPEQPYNTKWWR